MRDRRERRRSEDAVEVDIPDHLDWRIERVLTSGRYHVGRREVEDDWTFEQLAAANDMLDVLEDAEHEAAERARRRSESQRQQHRPR